MSFLKSGLNFAERFLDDLDKKAEGARSQKASASTAAQPVDAGGPSVFTRRSLQAVDATGVTSCRQRRASSITVQQWAQ